LYRIIQNHRYVENYWWTQYTCIINNKGKKYQNTQINTNVNKSNKQWIFNKGTVVEVAFCWQKRWPTFISNAFDSQLQTCSTVVCRTSQLLSIVDPDCPLLDTLSVNDVNCEKCCLWLFCQDHLTFTYGTCTCTCVVMSWEATVVHSGHLFPKASHNTTVLKCCVVKKLSQHNTLKLLCCENCHNTTN